MPKKGAKMVRRVNIQCTHATVQGQVQKPYFCVVLLVTGSELCKLNNRHTATMFCVCSYPPPPRRRRILALRRHFVCFGDGRDAGLARGKLSRQGARTAAAFCVFRGGVAPNSLILHQYMRANTIHACCKLHGTSCNNRGLRRVFVNGALFHFRAKPSGSRSKRRPWTAPCCGSCLAFHTLRICLFLLSFTSLARPLESHTVHPRPHGHLSPAPLICSACAFDPGDPSPSLHFPSPLSAFTPCLFARFTSFLPFLFRGLSTFFVSALALVLASSPQAAPFTTLSAPVPPPPLAPTHLQILHHSHVTMLPIHVLLPEPQTFSVSPLPTLQLDNLQTQRLVSMHAPLPPLHGAPFYIPVTPSMSTTGFSHSGDWSAEAPTRPIGWNSGPRAFGPVSSSWQPATQSSEAKTWCSITNGDESSASDASDISDASDASSDSASDDVDGESFQTVESEGAPFKDMCTEIDAIWNESEGEEYEYHMPLSLAHVWDRAPNTSSTTVCSAPEALVSTREVQRRLQQLKHNLACALVRKRVGVLLQGLGSVLLCLVVSHLLDALLLGHCFVFSYSSLTVLFQSKTDGRQSSPRSCQVHGLLLSMAISVGAVLAPPSCGLPSTTSSFHLADGLANNHDHN